MQRRSAHAQAHSGGEIRMDRLAGIRELDSLKPGAVFRADRNPEFNERRDAIRHEAFSTRFVLWSRGAIGYRDAKASPARRDRRGEPGGSASDHKNVGVVN